MIIDVYSVGKEIAKNFGPHMISFEHTLLDPWQFSYNYQLPTEVLTQLGGLFFSPAELIEDQTRELKNGANKIIRLGVHGLALEAMVLEKLPKAIERLQEGRGPVITRYGVESNENEGMMQFQDYVKGMQALITYALENKRDLFAVTHNARPRWSAERADGKTISMPRKDTNASAGCACGIHGARINTVDAESRTYTGEIEFSDGIEGFRGRDAWIAHPIPAEVGFKHRRELYIRGSRGNCLTGGYHFTLIPEVDRALRDYIYPMIKEVEKAMALKK